MGELELLAAISKKLTRDQAYRFVKYGDYKPYVSYGRKCQEARQLVSRHFELRPEHVVHHEDRDARKNSLINLKVFADNSDHLRYHRGLLVKPIWEGANQLD